ncbi:ATP-binding protein [Streptomyces sp. YC504]|uniref:ATP-binding protein n=1 Tax=Streptomyces mesophilus TaxID=1775132 RepID=A0A6G4XC85_9ACTN|nr:ATP-binding protein [Streptomyces mesophilus]NGO74772.1 ATP-binding protein [Streptomyces mesophilus]
MTTTADPTALLDPWGAAATAGTASQLLESEADSEKVAWQFVVTTLERWGCRALAPRVLPAAGELVANAFAHGVDADGPGAYPCPVVLCLLRSGSDVVCAVFDPAETLPRRTAAYGLRRVDAVADAWGWTAPGPDGKAVWAAFSGPGAGRRSAAAVMATLDPLLVQIEVFTGSATPRLVLADPSWGVEGPPELAPAGG